MSNITNTQACQESKISLSYKERRYLLEYIRDQMQKTDNIVESDQMSVENQEKLMWDYFKLI